MFHHEEHEEQEVFNFRRSFFCRLGVVAADFHGVHIDGDAEIVRVTAKHRCYRLPLGIDGWVEEMEDAGGDFGILIPAGAGHHAIQLLLGNVKLLEGELAGDHFGFLRFFSAELGGLYVGHHRAAAGQGRYC